MGEQFKRAQNGLDPTKLSRFAWMPTHCTDYVLYLAVTAITSAKIHCYFLASGHCFKRLSIANKDRVINKSDDVLALELAKHAANSFA